MACADCFRGNIHEGQPKGEVGNVHGLDTYISRPPKGTQSRGIVVIIPDAFGWKFGNNRLLADNYAEKGDFTVYLPDFMNDIIPFFYYCNPGKTFPVVKGFFEQLRKDEGATQPIGAAGFCWGGKHVVLLSHGHEIDGKPLLDAGFTAHPSMLSIPSDIQKIQRPVSFALAAKDDQISPAKADKVKAIVEALPSPATGEAYVIPGTGHGFAVRADLTKDDVAAQAARAEDQGVDWFNKHF
ncbi:hypothetical protein G3M48_005650 [Beauveria asiatica]|uniref:Dienelactone hydrolase domain-containing protein n=1 Tax=Beauveria asiatica TaxID=1069075 RepID=A0AAW0RQR5_9HYPO